MPKPRATAVYWPIYNLDRKNPYAPEEATHDPDVLLEKYKKLLGEIEETQNQLKANWPQPWRTRFSPEAGTLMPVAPQAPAPQLLGGIRQLLEQSRGRLATTVNSALTLLYRHIGHRVRTEVLGGASAATASRLSRHCRDNLRGATFWNSFT